MAVPLTSLWSPARSIGRAFTWAVATRSGKVHTEDEFGSLQLVPRDPHDPIVALAVVPVADPSDVSRYYQVRVPPGASPVIFWRMRRDLNGGSSAITVLGWRSAFGRCLLWIYDDGRVVVTDRDLDDLIDP